MGLDHIADKEATRDKRMLRRLRNMISGIAVLVGFAWERSFDAAVDNSADKLHESLEDSIKLPASVYVLLAACILAVIVFPVWRHFILPKFLEFEEEEKDEAEEGEEKKNEKEEAEDAEKAKITGADAANAIQRTGLPYPGNGTDYVLLAHNAYTEQATSHRKAFNDFSARVQQIQREEQTYRMQNEQLQAKCRELHRDGNLPREKQSQCLKLEEELRREIESNQRQTSIQRMQDHLKTMESCNVHLHTTAQGIGRL